MRDQPRPTVGFVGLLGEHIDVALIERSASALPEADFLLVGPLEAGTAPPAGANVHYHGAVAQAELPALLARMDVCTLPYTFSARNHYANPTKVREYLAAGRAVVATRQPGLADIEGPVTIADNADDYVAALRDAVAGAQHTSADQRRAISTAMATHTWSERARAFSTWL